MLDAPLAVVSVQQAKGLEFDSVVVVEPARIVAEHPHGGRALYLALTRTTRRLQVVSSEPLPAGLEPPAAHDLVNRRTPNRCHDSGYMTDTVPTPARTSPTTWRIEPMGPSAATSASAGPRTPSPS